MLCNPTSLWAFYVLSTAREHSYPTLKSFRMTDYHSEIFFAFIAQYLNGLVLDQCWDVHAHLIGIGDSDSGIFIKPTTGFSKSKQKLREAIFKYFTKSTQYPTDESYLDYFGKSAESAFTGFKSAAFAFTAYHDSDGQPQPHLSDFIIPNSWAKHASEKYSSLLYQIF